MKLIIQQSRQEEASDGVGIYIDGIHVANLGKGEEVELEYADGREYIIGAICGIYRKSAAVHESTIITVSWDLVKVDMVLDVKFLSPEDDGNRENTE